MFSVFMKSHQKHVVNSVRFRYRNIDFDTVQKLISLFAREAGTLESVQSSEF